MKSRATVFLRLLRRYLQRFNYFFAEQPPKNRKVILLYDIFTYLDKFLPGSFKGNYKECPTKSKVMVAIHHFKVFFCEEEPGGDNFDFMKGSDLLQS